MNTLLRFLGLALFLVACDGAADPDAGPTDSGASPIDAAHAIDAGTDAGSTEDAGGGDPDAGTPSCGTAQPDVSSIRGTEGAIIARDGTLYFSQSGGVGRMTPDGTIDASWASVGGAGATVWGLALDAANETLFVGVPGDGVYSIDLTTAAPAPSRIVTGGAPNGLTVGPDGMLYYSDFSAGRVYRVDPAGGTPSEVTASRIANANGVAFESAGTLLVASYSTGNLIRLTLTDGAETARETAAMGLGAPDGLALDATGRIYVTDNGGGEVLRVNADGTGRTSLDTGIPAAAALEFGAGPLSCADLYVASSGALVRITTDSTGAAVLWH